MSQNMPKGLQIRKMRDELRGVGVSADLVDLESLTDARLSYPENYRNIMARYKRVDNASRKTHRGTILGGVGNIDMKYASQSHQARSPQARQADEARKNKRAYTEKDLNRKPSLLDSWFRNPGRSDIFGIDWFGSSKATKGTRKRR